MTPIKIPHMNKAENLVKPKVLDKECSIDDYSFESSLNLAKSKHALYKGTINCEGTKVHGKRVCRETCIRVVNSVVPKYGKAKEFFYLDELKSKEFDKLSQLITYYETH